MPIYILNKEIYNNSMIENDFKKLWRWPEYDKV